MKYLHVFLDGSRSEEKELYAVSPENKSSTYSNLSKLECWQFEKSYCKSTTINIEWNFYRYKQWPKQRIPLKHYWTILYLKIAVPMMRTLCCRAEVVLNYNNKCLCFNNRLVVSWLKQRIFSTQGFDTAPNIQMENQSIPSQISMYFHHPKIGQLFLGLCLYSKKHV